MKSLEVKKCEVLGNYSMKCVFELVMIFI